MSRGLASVQWSVGMGLVVLPLVVAVLSVSTMYQRAATASLAAQEAARAAVLSDTWPDAVEGATRAAESVAVSRCGSGCVDVEVVSSTVGELKRSSVVTVVATVTMPAVTLPVLGPLGSFEYRVRQAELVDAHRSLP